MKGKRLLIRNMAAVLLLCAGFASCSEDELTEQGTPLPVGQYPLELTSGGLQAVATPAQPATRGTFEGNWDGVERVTVMVNDKTDKTKEYKVEVSEDKKTALLTPADLLENDDELFWWTSKTERKTVTAWVPYDKVLNEAFTLPTEWTEDNLAQYDIIGVRQPIVFEDKNNPLTFNHLMAKVVINLRETEYLKNAKDVKVLFNNPWQKGILKVDDNEIYAENVLEGSSIYVPPYLLPKETYEEVDFEGSREKPFAVYTALVAPSYTTNKTVLQIEVDDAQHMLYRQDIVDGQYTSIYYRGGQITTFNVTVKKHGLSVAVENDNIGWDMEGSNGKGEVELP